MRTVPDYDVIVIGSGFGGSVAALRLTEKGYRVAVLEAGRRFTRDTLPRSNWQLRDYLWFPRLGLRGVQRMTLLRDVFVVSGAGVGGGSLVYANTLYRPPRTFFTDRHWAHITDWEAELTPAYDQAERMLGVVDTPWRTPADDVLEEVGRRLGCADTFHPTRIGVFVGEPGVEVADPYFGGVGPPRTGCVQCGACMVGCRFGAKNTLDTNYLYLAERLGCVIHPETEVVDLRGLPDGRWEVIAKRPGWSLRRRRFRATQVVFAAGALGTQRLLQDLRHRDRLPALSPRLGDLTRTNSEAVVGATTRRRDLDLSRGVAITSSIHPDPHTHIEPVRYPAGSNLMGLLATLMVDGGGRIPRPVRFLLTALRHPLRFLRTLSVRRWSERTVILLVMQNLDNSLRMRRRRIPLGGRLTTRQGHGRPNPTWIPIANRAAREAADIIGGEPIGSWFEALLDVPTTAHLIGGCPIGDRPDTGVIDPYHRVWGYPTLHIVDGSTIPANLGVNPALTITAMAERAMSLWPNAGDPDPRPPQGAPYRRLAPVPPRRPAVPAHAPAALRLTEVS